LEDEPLVAIMLEHELETMGIHVVGPANNLKSALQLAEFSSLDGALLDLNINGEYTTMVADKLGRVASLSSLSQVMLDLLGCATGRFSSCVSHLRKLISVWR
jgi:DNA-binding NarL/FixJ family response regulator